MAPVVKQESGVNPGASSTPGSSSRLSRADSEYQVADPGAGGYDEAEYGEEYGYEDDMEYGAEGGMDPGQAKGKITTTMTKSYLKTFARLKTLLLLKQSLCLVTLQ